MKHRARTVHKHETEQDRSARLAKAASAPSHADGFHNRVWQQGPPEAWMAEHAEYQSATLFSRRSADAPTV